MLRTFSSSEIRESSTSLILAFSLASSFLDLGFSLSAADAGTVVNVKENAASAATEYLMKCLIIFKSTQSGMSEPESETKPQGLVSVA